MMADWISDLKVNQHDSNSLKAEDLQKDIDRGKFMRSLVRANKASFYRGGVFIRLSAESKQELDTQTTRLRSIVRTPQRTAHRRSQIAGRRRGWRLSHRSARTNSVATECRR